MSAPILVRSLRELDALVAEKVMGYWLAEGGSWFGPHPSMPGERCHASCAGSNRIMGPDCWGVDGLPKFSDRMEAAWEVVEKLDEKWSRFNLGHTSGVGWEAWTDSFSRAEAATAPLAIVLAALKAVGVEVELRLEP